MNFKKYKLFFVAFLVAGLLLSFSFVVAKDYGLNQTVGVGGLKDALSVDNVDSDDNFLSSRLGVLIGAILSFIGVLFLVLIIYGGILWMTATGNEQQVTKAKSLIVQAVIGLIIVLAAYAITAFIGEQLTS